MEVEISSSPNASESTVTPSVKSPSTDRKISTEGLRERKPWRISAPRRPALEGDQPARPDLDEQDHQQDHVGLRRQRVGGVEPFDPLLEEADQRGARQRAPDIADAAHHNGHEALHDVI